MKAYSYEEKKATAHIGMIGTNVLILFAFSLLAGILFCEFVCHKNITIYQGLVLVCCSIVISFLWYFLKRKVHHPFLIGSAGICLLSLPGGVFWWNGALQTINGILQWYSKRTGNLAEEYAVSDRFVAVGTIFFASSLLLLSLWIIQYFLDRRNVPGMVIGMLPFYLVAFFFGKHFVIMCAIGLWIVFLYCLHDAFRYGYVLSAQKEKCTIGLLTLCILLTGIATGAGIVYEDQFVQWKRAEKNKIETKAFGTADLYEGDFTGKRKATDSKELRLTVETDSDSVFYLKGFVGSNYQDRQWKALDDSVYAKKHQERFRWLAHRNWSVWTQEFKALSATSYREQGTKKVRVKNVQASRKYQYQPYFGMTNAGSMLKKGHDSTLQNEWYAVKKDTTYRMIEMKDMDYLTIQTLAQLESRQSQKEISDYLESEWTYREFVKEEYLTIPKEFQHFFTQQIKKNVQTMSVQEKATMIRQYLLDLTDGNEETADDFTDQNYADPILAFLQKQRAGGSASYASAGTLLFRYLGVPARYVEGYVSLPESMNSTAADTQTDEETDGTLHEKNSGKSAQTIRNIYADEAHAWVEIYQDGLGWIPVEVSPKYYGEGERAHRKQRVDQVKTEELQMNVKMPPKKLSEKHTIPIQRYVGIMLGMIVLLIVFLLLHRSICRYQRKKGRQQGTLPDQIGYLAKELSYWLKADGVHEMIQRSDAFIDQMQKYERLSDDRTQKSPSNDLSQQSENDWKEHQDEKSKNGFAKTDKYIKRNFQKKASSSDFAKAGKNISSDIWKKECNIEQVLTILERRAFSEEEAKAEEKHSMEIYVEHIRKQIFRNASRFKKAVLVIWYGI